MTVERRSWSMVALLVAGLLLQSGISSVNAAWLDVGGSNGWTFPPNGIATFFNDWAEQQIFNVGDTLFFRYKYHSVIEVSKADAASCTTTKPLNSYNSAENATVTLDRLGYYAFICGFPSHCSANMKLELTVLAPGQTAPPVEAPAAVFPATDGPTDAVALGPSPTESQSGSNRASTVRSLPAMVLGAIFAACAFLFL